MTPESRFDPRSNPVLSKLHEINGIWGDENNKPLLLRRLRELGDFLVPHVQNHDQTISIGDFIPNDMRVDIVKKQFWFFIVTFARDSEYETSFEIEKHFLSKGDGVSLFIKAFKGKEAAGRVHLVNDTLKYRLQFNCLYNTKEEIESGLVLERAKFGIGSQKWKMSLDKVQWSPVQIQS